MALKPERKTASGPAGRKPEAASRRRLPPAVFLVLAFLATVLYAAAGVPGLRGVAGSWLKEAFGPFGWWPGPVLAAAAFLTWRKRPLTAAFFLKTAGGVLFFFSVLALAAHMPFSGGGGHFGAFLARGAFRIGLGAWLLLPLAALAGLILALPPLGRGLLALLAKFWAATAGAPEPPHEGESAAPAPADGPAEKAPLPAAPVITGRNKPAPEPAETARAPEGDYKLPGLDLLDPGPAARRGGHASGLTQEELESNAHLLEDKLRNYGVEGRVSEVSGGPVITMYEYEPAPGIKIARVAGLAEDLAMAMKAKSIRVAGHLPGKGAIGIEIPNLTRLSVSFRQVVESPAFRRSTSFLTLSLGVDILGEPVVADLAAMPHLLIAGATGTGKSVALAAIIMSILYKAPPDKVRLLMIDPKVVEFALYRDIPHLIYPVLTEPAQATLGLKWAVAEMENRYRLLAEFEARHIDGYNEKVRAERKKRRRGEEDEARRELPYLVIIIDELADLMMVASKEVEIHVTRLAQKARAAGIHLILATQRPTTDIITGTIKSNLPTRIALKVLSQVDSRTILDRKGAEKLLGRGDMLFLAPNQSDLQRLHGPFVSDGEIQRVTDFLRAWGPPDYLDELTVPEAEAGETDGGAEDNDPLYGQAVELVRRTSRATISHIQRHLRVGYNRAARLIERMEREGLIGPQDGTRPRDIF
ncbi:MAG: DNA translocase FtsK [Candidatus Adiutrix sp.]|nr:DNA translocase FtsK [Candidatus Adiutrix sp.]